MAPSSLVPDTAPEPFAYDAVPYDSEATVDTHPGVIGTIARLFGLRAAAPSTCRVLEIGCGDGENLLAMAAYLPRATFRGIDLAAGAIAKGSAIAPPNVHLSVADVATAGDLGAFDYVIVHGFVSWVPDTIADRALALARASLAPGGVAFVSANALPGWELRRALRLLARHANASAGVTDPAEAVARTLAMTSALGELPAAAGFLDTLSATARGYLEHVEAATPEEAPFSRYVFHDLLAPHNHPFTVDELAARGGAAGLRLVAEVPLASARVAPGFPGIAGNLAAIGVPFVQALFCRDDDASAPEPDPSALLDSWLWADLAPEGANVFRTTSGARVRPTPGGVFARAAAHAPGFVRVRDLGGELAHHEVFAAVCAGALRVVPEPPPTATRVPTTPRVAEFVRARAAEAVARGARSRVLTSAMHASFEVPYAELLVVRELDGKTPLATIEERVAAAVAEAPRLASDATATGIRRHVASVLERFARYAFLLEAAP